MLVLIGLGAVHLSGQGTAVPTAIETTAPAAADPTEAAAASGTEGATSPPADGTASAEGGTSGQGDDADDAKSGDVVVHVSGAVAEPGVVTLPAGSRVDAAVQAAGGPTEDAELDSVNLARTLVDGEQIHVPLPGEEPPAVASAPAEDGDAGQGTTDDATGSAGAGGSGLIDLNTADAAALEELPGVGPAIAARIIEYRDANGPFTSVDELEEVPGIGPVTLEEIRPMATV